MQLEGQVAIVTGGAGRIGVGVCRALAKAGAQVVALDVRAGAADVRTVTCDLTDAAACAAAVADVVAELGPVTILANLAQRLVVDTAMTDLTAEDMQVSFETGPIATLRMMQLCYPHMRAAGGGAIVNFASEAGTAGLPRHGAYAAAKEAIRGLTKVAALEWGSDNIRVNAICPVSGAEHEKDHPLFQGAIGRGFLGRLGDPETDIGSVIVFLASGGGFITGRTLFVDGGSGAWR